MRKKKNNNKFLNTDSKLTIIRRNDVIFELKILFANHCLSKIATGKIFLTILIKFVISFISEKINEYGKE